MKPIAELQFPWLVWSNEHNAFWRANRCGYTGRIEEAGRYSREEAERICRNASPRANSTIHEGTPPEIRMPAPEAQDALLSRIEALEKGLRPFADYLDNYRDDLPDHIDLACFDMDVEGLTIGDFRRARQLLSSPEKGSASPRDQAARFS